MAQLPLALALADHASFDTFVGAGNAPAVEHVRSAAAGAADTLWLWGGDGVGKSHLLQAACRAAAAAGRRAMYVALPADFEARIPARLDASASEAVVWRTRTDSDGRFRIERAPAVPGATLVARLDPGIPVDMAEPQESTDTILLVVSGAAWIIFAPASWCWPSPA